MSSTDIESEHDEESGCDSDNVEESSFAEMQESNDNDITTKDSDGSSHGSDSDGSSRGSNSDSEYESDFSESTNICEAVDIEDLRVLRDNNEQRNAYILRELKKWAMRGVSCKKIDALLRVLQIVYPTLPRTYRTLLKTPRITNLVDMENGKFWYKGIRRSVVPRLSEKYLSDRRSIRFDINIDGLELYHSSRQAANIGLSCG